MLIELNRGIKLMELEKQIGFLENQIEEMSNRIKNLEYDLAEMSVENTQLRERVKTLATRIPSWPKGYRPQRTNKHGRSYTGLQPLFNHNSK